MELFDLCVVGGGPGGLSAAIRGARSGASVCLVETDALGGTCLNRGCIPARAMGTTARLMSQLKRARELGIQLRGEYRVDLARVVSRKERILKALRFSLESLLKRSKVRWLPGQGILQSATEVEVKNPGKPTLGIKARGVVLATGSRPCGLPGCPIDGKRLVTSDELLDLSELPLSLVVVGAGVVGCEFASYFADLGSQVTLVEAESRILPGEEERISEAFCRSLQNRGVTVLTGTKVLASSRGRSSEACLTLSNGESICATVVLVAAGRIPQLPPGASSLGLEICQGRLEVDETLRTQVRSIFGIGDLLGEYQLACTASYEGALAAENALGRRRKTDYRVVPNAIYTEPEIARVGLTEKQAREQGRSVKVSRLSFTGFARAQTFEETDGFVQVVAEDPSGRILGVQILGARATDLIGEAALAIQYRLTLKDLVQTLHGHPTMSESLWEAAAMALGQSIYYATGR